MINEQILNWKDYTNTHYNITSRCLFGTYRVQFSCIKEGKDLFYVIFEDDNKLTYLRKNVTMEVAKYACQDHYGSLQEDYLYEKMYSIPKEHKGVKDDGDM